MSDILPVCTLCDDRFTPHCGAMVASLLTNCNDSTHVVIHIFDGGISVENKEKLQSLSIIRPFEIYFHRMNDADFDDCAPGFLPVTTYYRLKLASTLPDISKILYLDSDIIVLEDPVALLKDFPDGAWCSAVADTLSEKNRKRLQLEGDAPYANAGVMVIDLDAWRRHGVEEAMFDYARKHPGNLKYQDQDLLNVALRGHIHYLDLRWNSQYVGARYSPPRSRLYSSSFRNPAIIHFVTSEKPWLVSSGIPRRHFYFLYLSLTPWCDDILAIWRRERFKAAPHIRKWSRIIRDAFHFHLKKGYRLIRFCGLTLLQDEPRF